MAGNVTGDGDGGFRYSAWDGSQEVPDFSAGEVLDQITDDLLRSGDPRDALQNLLQRGFRLPDGRRFEGLRRMLQQMRRERESMLDRYDPSRMVDSIREHLNQIVNTERSAIESRREDTPEGRESSDPSSPGARGSEGSEPGSQAGEGAAGSAAGTPESHELQAMLDRILDRKAGQLDRLPDDNAGRIRGLREYDFVSPEAREAFEQLIGGMQRRLLQQYAQGLKEGVGKITPEDLAGIRQMVQELNQMIEASRQGDRQAFDEFMQRWGGAFPDGIESLDDLLQHLQRQTAELQALLDSMDPESRKELSDMIGELLRDDRLQLDLARLAANLAAMGYPPGSSSFPFRGDDAPGFGESLDMMSRLQAMERLENSLARDPISALMDASQGALGQGADPSAFFSRRMSGQIEAVKDLVEALVDEGYLKREGERFELTPRAVRRLGDSALKEIFGRLRADHQGGHQTQRRGAGGDVVDQSKPYVFGDPFHVDLHGTLMNGVRRGGGSPLRLAPSDFDVFETERAVRHATVLAIDTSRSMFLRGLSLEAKKMALALDSLIRGQFPKDVLYIIGFADVAFELQRDELPALAENYLVQGTNYEMALALSRRLLARHRGGNRQVLFVTDGEPTACAMPSGGIYVNYPAPSFVRRAALAEAARCRREGIVVNTFMLDEDPGLVAFVERMTAVNRGRAILSGPYRLGERVVLDYLDRRVTKRI